MTLDSMFNFAADRDGAMYNTKVTRLNTGYGCRVLKGTTVVVQTCVPCKADIAPAFRDLLRTLDGLGGDEFTSAARARNNKPGNRYLSVKHVWGDK